MQYLLFSYYWFPFVQQYLNMTKYKEHITYWSIYTKNASTSKTINIETKKAILRLNLLLRNRMVE